MSIISMKSSSSISENLLDYQNESNDNPERIANILNNYFSTIGEKTNAKIKHSLNNYIDQLEVENTYWLFFLELTQK